MRSAACLVARTDNTDLPCCRIFRWGSSYHVYSFLRVWASYDGHFVEVVPAPSARGQHCGICGNYNRVQSDELIGKDLQKLSSPEQLVKDWEWKC